MGTEQPNTALGANEGPPSERPPSERSQALLDALPRVLLNLGARVRLNFGARGRLVSSGYRGPWYTPGRQRENVAKPAAVTGGPAEPSHSDWHLSEEVAKDYEAELARRRLPTRG